VLVLAFRFLAFLFSRHKLHLPERQDVFAALSSKANFMLPFFSAAI
jgi:hypothetical protein